MVESQIPSRFRRLRPPRLPRWYLVDGKPRRSLWPPQAAQVSARDAEQLLALAREAASAHSGTDDAEAPERRRMRAVLELLERTLEPIALRRSAPERADAGAVERPT